MTKAFSVLVRRAAGFSPRGFSKAESSRTPVDPALANEKRSGSNATVPLVFALVLGFAGPLSAEPLSKAKRGDWPMWGGSTDRNMVSGETGIPREWDAKTRKNIKWIAPLGSQTYGNPVIVDGKIFVGTNNNGHLRPGITGDKGVIVCVAEKTGKFLWQATSSPFESIS